MKCAILLVLLAGICWADPDPSASTGTVSSVKVKFQFKPIIPK